MSCSLLYPYPAFFIHNFGRTWYDVTIPSAPELAGCMLDDFFLLVLEVDLENIVAVVCRSESA